MIRKPLVGEAWTNSREKRAVDLAYCGVATPLLAPVAVSALALSRLVDGPGPLFSHERPGQYGEAVTVYKVRTITNTAPSAGHNYGVLNPHTTEFGKIIRPFGIDEIPQLFNVVSNDMTIVGLRPLIPSTYEATESALSRSEYDEWEDAHYRSKPGLISSRSIDLRHTGQYDERSIIRGAKMDLHDFQNTSFTYDNKLLLRAAKLASPLLKATAKRIATDTKP